MISGWVGGGALVFGLAFFAKRPWAKNWLADRWRWMVIPLICLSGIYLPVYVLSVDQRYFYLFLPLIMILTLGLVSQFFATNWLTGFVLSSLFLLPLLWRSPSRLPVGSFAQDLAKRMESAGMVGPIVGSTFVSPEGHRLGLYVAWYLGQPWHGDVRPASLEAYKHSGARFAIAIGGSPLAKQLDADPAFKHVSTKLGEKGCLQVYEVQASQP